MQPKMHLAQTSRKHLSQIFVGLQHPVFSGSQNNEVKAKVYDSLITCDEDCIVDFSLRVGLRLIKTNLQQTYFNCGKLNTKLQMYSQDE